MRRKVRIQRKREGGRTEESERVGEMVECWKGKRRRAKKGKGGEKRRKGGRHGRERGKKERDCKVRGE